jgi:hypothetical protein
MGIFSTKRATQKIWVARFAGILTFKYFSAAFESAK